MKHLTYDDRLTIQQMIYQGYSCTKIAAHLNKDRTTISRELQKHRSYTKPSSRSNLCIHRYVCDIPKTCKEICPYRAQCKTCWKCNQSCPNFEMESCKRVSKVPYVCVGCSRRVCSLGKWTYSAKKAQLAYEEELKTSRQGISLPDEDIKFLNENVVPLIKNGISVSVACQKFKDRMPVSPKTVYSYIDSGILNVTNLDLRLKLRRPLRKKTGPVLRVDKHCHVGRSYGEYEKFIAANPNKTVCEMDSVIGTKGGKVILSLHFLTCDLQLYFLRENNTASTVTATFNMLREKLGDDYSKLFQVILTDRGSEFTDPLSIELDSETGEIQSNVFYCDPMQSNQKSNCERNHELFRYIFPKGTSFNRYSQEDIALAMNHINSYPREKWNWKTPIDLFEEIYGIEIMKKLGLEKIPLEQIKLTPTLINK